MTKLPKPKSLPENAEKVFNGQIFDIYQWSQVMYNGLPGIFERAVRPDSTHVLAVTEAGKVLINKEQQPDTGVFYSLPGGRLEPNLTPEENLKKELLEETGYQSENIDLLFQTNTAAKVVGSAYYFLAKNCVKVTDQNLDAGEKIEVLELTFEEFMELIIGDDFRGHHFSYFILKLAYQNKLEDFKNQIFS